MTTFRDELLIEGLEAMATLYRWPDAAQGTAEFLSRREMEIIAGEGSLYDYLQLIDTVKEQTKEFDKLGLLKPEEQ